LKKFRLNIFFIVILVAGCSSTINEQEKMIRLKPVAESEELNEAADIAYSKTHNLFFVSQTAEHQITVLDEKLNTVNRFGRPGNGPGDLNRPTSLYIHNGKLYLFEEGNSRLSVFTGDGKFIQTSRIDHSLRLMNFIITDDSVAIYASNTGAGHLVADKLDCDEILQRFGTLSNEDKPLRDRLRNLGYIHRIVNRWVFVSPFHLEAHIFDENFNPVSRQDLKELTFFNFLSDEDGPYRNAIQLYLGKVKKWDGDILASAWTLNDENEFRILKHLLHFSLQNDRLVLEHIFDLPSGGEVFTSFLPVGHNIYAYEGETGKLKIFEVRDK